MISQTQVQIAIANNLVAKWWGNHKFNQDYKTIGPVKMLLKDFEQDRKKLLNAAKAYYRGL